MIQVLDHLKITKAHFLSLSIGSVILQKIDILRPKLIDKMVMAGAIFDGSKFMHAFVHSGKILTYLLPYRVFYSLFSFIVLPRKNHRLSRYIFRRQSMRMDVVEYLKWVELYKPFFILIKEYVGRQIETPCLVVMGDQDHIFFNAAKKPFNKIASDFLKGLDIPDSIQSEPVPYKWSDLKDLKARSKGR